MRACGLFVFIALFTLGVGPIGCSSDSSSPDPWGPATGGSAGQENDGASDDVADASHEVDPDHSTLPDTVPEAAVDAPNDTTGGDLDVNAEPMVDDDAQESGSCEVMAGMGQLACSCNELYVPLANASSPFQVEDHLDFGSAGWDSAKLTAGGQQILAAGNLNDGSLKSEIVAYEVVSRCDSAQLLKTERTVEYYDPNGKKTDLVVQLAGHKVGISVVRAYHYPSSTPYTVAEAQAKLLQKLADIPLSEANVKPQDAWDRSILAVIAWDQHYADAVATAWNQLASTDRANVILVVTVTDGDDSALY
jgi:hypothetical protein